MWSIAAVLVVIGWARKRRAKRRRLAQMGEAEQRVDELRSAHWEPDVDRTPRWKDPGEGKPNVH